MYMLGFPKKHRRIVPFVFEHFFQKVPGAKWRYSRDLQN
jgi:hypothetical protein